MMNVNIEKAFLQQEKANSLSHGAGLLFGLIAIPHLILTAIKKDFPGTLPATCIYGVGFLLVFTFSTLYHSFHQPKTKQVLKILDHISIYFLIAGTYTPFIIIFVHNTFGTALLVVLWGLTLLGILFKVFFTGRFEILSTHIYVSMGLLILAGGRSFFIAMPVNIIKLIIIGAALYCTGIIFYIYKIQRFHHTVWHLFVLSAAICHYFAVLKSLKFH